MSVPPAEAKQAVIRQMLQSLAGAQAPAVQVRLLARIAEGTAGIRGILNPSPRPAAPPPPPVDESPLPPPFRSEASPSLDSLRVGHELHVVVTASRRGYLHLFNLGTSGDARRMLPRPNEAPALLEPGRAYLASASGTTPWIEQGPVNGHPERILAIVTAQPSSVPASLLHPSFSDGAVVRGFSPPMVDALLAAWPAADWAWGCCDARVEN